MRFIRAVFRTSVIALSLAAMVAMAQGPLARPEPQLTLVDRAGNRTVVGSLPAGTFAPRISPDGREVVFDTSGDGSVWIAKLSDLTSKRLVVTGGQNRGPMWSGDGKRVLYITDHEGAETLFWRTADGNGAPELLTKPARAPESWSPLQTGFSFITFNGSGDYDVWMYSLADKRVTPVAVVPSTPQHSSRFSPDGRWIAYVSGESGRLEVYVRPVSGQGQAIQVTKSGGGHPLWSPDQKELFFDNAGQMFAVAVNTEPRFTAAEPSPLPITGFVQGPLRRQYDIMPDGKQFLMMFQPGR